MAQSEKAQTKTFGRSFLFDTNNQNESLQEDSIDWPTVLEDEEEPDWNLDWKDNPIHKRVPKAKKSNPKTQTSGLKKNSLKASAAKDMPPTPLGHEWRETEGGWNLIRCWSEKDSLLGKKVKKERYAGYLSRQAWQVIKEYEHEKIISQIGQQLRRHGGR